MDPIQWMDGFTHLLDLIKKGIEARLPHTAQEKISRQLTSKRSQWEETRRECPQSMRNQSYSITHTTLFINVSSLYHQLYKRRVIVNSKIERVAAVGNDGASLSSNLL